MPSYIPPTYIRQVYNPYKCQWLCIIISHHIINHSKDGLETWLLTLKSVTTALYVAHDQRG